MIQYKNQHLTVFESALFRTTSTVVQTEDLILVVDPNWLPGEVRRIKNYVEEIKGNKPVYLLFTHSDYDHIIGYKAFPDVKVIASRAFEDQKDKEKILKQIRDFDDEYYISRDYEIVFPKVDIQIKEDGQTFEIGKTKLVFYLAEGHNDDGIFTIVENSEAWIAGDYLSNIEFPYIYHSSLEYEKTIQKTERILSTHHISLMITGHGDIATSEEEILQRKKDSLDYINELRNSLKEGKVFDLDKLWRKYKFPGIMKKFHDGNISLIKQELSNHI